MKKLLKFFVAILLIIAASAVLIHGPAYAADQTWAIYWYLCGSDLESDGGAATRDIQEALEVELPESVKFIIQTGGAKEWHNDIIDAEALYRVEQIGDELEIVDELPLGNMGDPNTLRGFIEFCEENYPADRKALFLWNHGSGSGGGICYDEIYDDDFISFAKLKEVLTELYGESPGETGKKPFELIGFDACLMATLDMAGLAAPYAHYLVASEELEP